MANRERGEYRLDVGSLSFTLRLTAERCAEIEERSSVDFPVLIDQVNHGRVTAVRWILWGALQDRHPLSVDDTGRLMDAIGGPASAVRVLAAFLLLNIDGESQPSKRGSVPVPTRQPWRALYLDARSLGLAPDLFWSLTLRELWLEVAATRQRMDRDVTLAWQMAVLSRTEKIPTLASLLSTAQAGTDLVQSMFAIADQYGLKVKVTRKAMH